MGIKFSDLFLAFVIATTQALLAQSNQETEPAGKSTSTQAQAQANKLQKLSKIQQWIASMRDESRAATTMAQLADTTWPVDEDYARGLFRFSLSKVAAELKRGQACINCIYGHGIV